MRKICDAARKAAQDGRNPRLRQVRHRQGSEEWLAWRRRRVTASEAAIAVGAAPSYHEVRTWTDLRRAKTGAEPEPDPKTAEIFAYGHEWEPVAREVLGVALGDGPTGDGEAAGPWIPLCFEREIFGASLDGCVPPRSQERRPDRNEIHWPPVWIEIKCPWRKRASATWREVEKIASLDRVENPDARRMPAHIWWQMVHQAGTLFGAVPPERRSRLLAALAVFCPADHTVPPEVFLDRLRATAPGWGKRKARSLADRLLRERMAIVFVGTRDLLEDWPRLEREWLRFRAGAEQSSGMLRAFP